LESLQLKTYHSFLKAGQLTGFFTLTKTSSQEIALKYLVSGEEKNLQR
jgi:hypothetical protein